MPEFIEGDIFRIIVPLDDSYSYDFGASEIKSADKVPISADKMPISADKYSNKKFIEAGSIDCRLFAKK